MIITLLLIAALVTVSRADWPMAGANPQRTSWVSEEIRGGVSPVWYRPIEPYISQNVHTVAAEGKLFVSTARGLYALDAANGNVAWVYPTEIPLGHSPTYNNGTLYVGGFDRRLHAIEAATGQQLWTFDDANAGYRTNALVVDDKVMLGSRDGWFYAVRAHGQPNQGQLVWKYKTNGPILYSAAYKDGVIFFCSQDMHCYALNATDGSVKWVSDKLHGQGFNSWWPVIYRNRVVLTTRANYREYQSPGCSSAGVTHDAYQGEIDTELVNGIERDEIYPTGEGWIGALGNEPGDWAPGTSTVNAQAAIDYFTAKPWRRNRYFLDIETGTDMEISPVLTLATKNGSASPAIVSGYDDVIYLPTNYKGSMWICRGGYSGWKIGTPFISRAGGEGAVDEPRVASGGGSVLYESICCDREGRGLDLANPGTRWTYWSYNFPNLCPGYDEMWFGVGDQDGTGNRLWGYYGSLNGVYHDHSGDQNPLIPYNGHLYIHRSNAVVCFGPEGGSTKRPLSPTQSAPDENIHTFTTAQLEQMLAVEIQKWLDAGHLQPGWFNGGQWCVRGNFRTLNDYFMEPGDNLWVLLRALPYLPPDMQTQLRAFIQSEYNAYSPVNISKIGWQDGASRDWFIYPPEVVSDFANYPKSTYHISTNRNIYAMWKYAQEFGSASAIYNSIKGKLPPASFDVQYAYPMNDSIAGHWAYLELEQMAGEPETGSIRAALNNMLASKVNNFAVDSPFATGGGGMGSSRIERHINTSRNFIFLTPELGQYLHDNIKPLIQEAANEYNYVEPYWFVSRYEGSTQENAIHNLHHTYALFQAKAWALKESRQELCRYLDVPAFMRGDVFYIHNLISTIEAEGVAPTITPDGGGIYIDPVTVTITAHSPEEIIYYTTDGNDPDPNSTQYTGGFVLSDSTTVKARSYLEGHPSSIVSSDFVIDTALTNEPPQVEAGGPFEITMPTNSIELDGTVTDNTLPWPPGVVTSHWEKVSGPGQVLFDDANAVDTTAVFSQDGSYVLRLTADDGELIASDDVNVIVNPKPNEAPAVDAGGDTAIIWPTDSIALNGVVTDDNLPAPPALVTVSWSKVSGPGTVTFTDQTSAATTATFSMRGTYTLKLTADDSDMEDSDTVIITVHPEGYTGPIACYELEAGATDSSGYGYHGTENGSPTYSSGVFAQAVALDGTEDFIELPVLNLNSNHVTITAWIKRSGDQNNYVGIIFSRDQSTTAGLNFRINNELGYHWNDDSSTWGWGSGIFVPDNQWVFIALVLEPSKATVYMNHDGTLTSSVNTLGHAIEEFNGHSNIGCDPHEQSRYVNGMIDSVRIYNRALSVSEIEVLANQNVPGDADVNNDGKVDFADLADLADQWLWAGNIAQIPEDISKDGEIDFEDFSLLANDWLIN